jgi:predicted dehydrogenase
MHKQPLNVAMVGYGFIGAVHSNAFHQVRHFFEVPYTLNLKSVCGRDQEKLRVMAARWGWEQTESDWRALIDRPDIQVIDIATPNALHAPIAIAAARAGKIVLCEKPLAMSLNESEAMVLAVRNTPNLVWFNYRRVPAVAFAKRLIEEGRIGEIYHYRAKYFNQSGLNPAKTQSWRYKRSEAGSGVSGDLLSHSIDIATYLNGSLIDLSAMTHTFIPGRDVDDAAMFMAKFSNGSIGTFEASRFGAGSRNQNTFEIHGSRGTLRFDLEDLNRLEFLDATDEPRLQAARNLLVTGPDHPYSNNFWKPGHAIGYEHTFIATLGDFLNAMAKQEEFHPNFEDGLSVQRVLDAVEKSAASGRWLKLG